MREVDFIGRLANNQFAVLLPETDSSSALEAAQRLTSEVASLTLNEEPDKELLAMSIGLVSFPTHGRDENSLLTAAVQSLQSAQENGNKICTA